MSSKVVVSSLVERGLALTDCGKRKKVGVWLLGVTGMVGGMVHVGGMTRLTKSGLSMTDWKPLGSLPPLTLEEWQTEFARYQTFPEYQQRKGMTLNDFQYIYYWEWGHRMMGRVVGVCFTILWLYYTYKQYIPKSSQPTMAALWCMGGTQGLVGWWMVQSGLTDDRYNDKKEIRVKPHRLATHLAMAFSTYSALLYTGLSFLYSDQHRQSLFDSLTKHTRSQLTKFRGATAITTGLTGLTVVSGAFVAGNDAGRAYNVFPHMMPDHQWLPDELWNSNESTWYNLTENTAVVQLNHRILGMTTATASIALATMSLRNRSILTPQARKGFLTLGGIAFTQASLGIITLINYVPIPLAALHQLGSLALVTSGMYTVHALRYAKKPTVQLLSKIPQAAFKH